MSQITIFIGLALTQRLSLSLPSHLIESPRPIKEQYTHPKTFNLGKRLLKGSLQKKKCEKFHTWGGGVWTGRNDKFET